MERVVEAALHTGYDIQPKIVAIVPTNNTVA
jgi:hypothetical protein